MLNLPVFNFGVRCLVISERNMYLRRIKFKFSVLWFKALDLIGKSSIYQVCIGTNLCIVAELSTF